MQMTKQARGYYCFPMNISRRVVVTGASTGIGLATARLLSQRGWDVIAVARRRERLEALAAEIGCEYWVADLTDQGQVEEMAAHVLETGPVDALVNNAGGAIGVDRVAEAEPARWSAMFERNVLTALHCTRAFLPAMRERGGDLVFLTSTAAHDTYPGGGGYVAAKHAERVIAATLRQELVGEPVRVIEIAPGMVRTEEFSLSTASGHKKPPIASTRESQNHLLLRTLLRQSCGPWSDLVTSILIR